MTHSANSYFAAIADEIEQQQAKLDAIRGANRSWEEWDKAFHEMSSLLYRNARSLVEALRAPTGPNNESVGPWKECVYKAKGAPASIEARIVVAAMLRLAEWRKENPEGLLPVQHHRAVRGVARELIEACLELEKSRTTATLRGIENG